MGRGKACSWDISSLLLPHPILPHILYFPLVLRQEKGRTGGKHTCVVRLWYFTLTFNQGWHKGAVSTPCAGNI